KGARSILFLITDPANIVKIIEEHEVVLDIFSRTLREEHKKSLELLIHLLGFFYSLSYYEEFHQEMSKHSIGETCVNIIEFQFAKYTIIRDELIRKEQSKSLSRGEYQKELDKFLFLVRKQDRVLRLAFTILMHLADDPKIEMKMVKKDI